MCFIQGTSVELTLLCVVMLTGTSTKQPSSTNWFYCCRQRVREKVNSLENTKRFMMNIWKSLLGIEQREKTERKHASSNCMCWLGGYMIDGASRVLVIILLGRSWSSRTDPGTVVHRRRTCARSPAGPEASRGQTGASHLTLLPLLPLYLFLIIILIFL